MDSLIPIVLEMYGESLRSVAASLPRIVGAFIMLPLLTNDVIPSLVRNCLYVSLSVVVVPLSLAQSSLDFESGFWPLLMIKEVFVGLSIGLVFGGVFWALTIAGGIIDSQTGANMASLVDPIQGHQSSLTSVWLSRLASVLFMVSGAFLVFLDVLLSSYRLWPVNQFFPQLSPLGIEFFAGQFGFMMTQAVLVSAPVLICLFLIDFGMGVINRFAQNMNVMAIATPIKSLCATLVLLLMLGMIVESVLRQVGESGHLLSQLNHLFGGG